MLAEAPTPPQRLNRLSSTVDMKIIADIHQRYKWTSFIVTTSFLVDNWEMAHFEKWSRLANKWNVWMQMYVRTGQCGIYVKIIVFN